MDASSLHDICLSLIADHAELIDSLEGFPEEVARRIWDQILAHPNKLESKCGASVLNTFVRAYPEEILDTCQISDMLLLNQYDLQWFALFRHVKHLDLQGCKMGDDHDLLPQISTLSALCNLSLSENCLSDWGISNLVNPYLLRGGCDKLFEINLSYNPNLTLKSISKCLKIVPLQRLTLDLSEIRLKILETEFPGILKRKNRLDLIKVETHGWAKPLVNRWLKVVQDQRARPKPKVSFYARQIAHENPKTKLKPTNPMYMFDRCRRPKRPYQPPDLKLEDDGVAMDLLAKYRKTS